MSSPESERGELRRIFAAAVKAVDPAVLVKAHLERHEADDPRWRDVAVASWRGEVLVVGAGKASAGMARGCEAHFGPERLRGLVIAPEMSGPGPERLELAFGGHPLPDRQGAEATRRLCGFAAVARAGPVLCLISGGASSLLVRPRPPLTLSDKIATNLLLLRAGAAIDELNTVRKHLSEVKGGGLLRLTSARPILTLILSDVVGDDPSTVGSGPTIPDPTTFAEAEEVLRRTSTLALVPDTVRQLLARGRRGEERETVKPGDPETADCETRVIGSNRDALLAAAGEAERLGYRAVQCPEALVGETRRAAVDWLDLVWREIVARPDEPCCVIGGGETTVNVRGSGRGGRNSEFALALAGRLAGQPLEILSAGTDGVDGPTDAAGAFVDGTTLTRACNENLDIEAMLANNDSYSFFARLGDLLRSGPTGTNVMDVKLALYRPSAAGAAVLVAPGRRRPALRPLRRMRREAGAGLR